MDTAIELFRQAGSAIVQLLLSPFYYIAILLVVLHGMRQTRLERRLFHVRLHIWPALLLRTIAAGVIVGFIMSTAGLFLGVAVTGEAVLWMWGAAALLTLFSVRYLCFAYSVGLLGIVQWLLGLTSLAERGDWFGQAAGSLAQLDIAGLLLLVALMHLTEALLVRWQGAQAATPLFLEGKRGKLVGGYMLQGYWPVPLIMLVPGMTPEGAAVGLPWTTLLDGSALSGGGWSMVGFPMMIGFSELTRSLLPADKARAAARGLLLYGTVVALAAIGAAWWKPLLPIAAGCSLLLHEGLVIISRLRESARSPIFVHDERGLKVLAVIPGSPAEAMGIVAGEIVHKVNGMKVRTVEELHTALHIHSAFCKLEVFNLEGQLKFVQRARYANEHHQLGVVLAPDDRAGYYAVPGEASLWNLLRRGGSARQRNSQSTSF
ncbi:PDZ domain-containing protein [Paenibacillus sp. GCM10027626]|uniref:PDZ domain-containing protein n=1 Tax=Paenibacillus sp. GCM10027626 TaxID=3273411 RepID=UPI003636AEAD